MTAEMMTQLDRDVRRFVRVPVDFSLKYRGEQGDTVGIGKCQNVSRDGAAFSTHTVLAQGSTLSMSIGSLTFDGVVVWVVSGDTDESTSIGVRLADDTPGDVSSELIYTALLHSGELRPLLDSRSVPSEWKNEPATPTRSNRNAREKWSLYAAACCALTAMWAAIGM